MAPLYAAALATALTTAVATGPIDPGAAIGRAGLQSRVTATTDCIVRAVAADPRYRRASADATAVEATAPAATLGDLIVDSMTACASTVREMIDAWDATYGEGSGEAFFMGPFLDVLPTAASRLLERAKPK
ncbi:hypothetical protein [Rhodoplanes sp. SY1]|uniref:hypothetical protein n=1 Tax=Rhodoplanes sp. SY1 TaxID=3166646 RepID=UPI0038B51DE3